MGRVTRHVERVTGKWGGLPGKWVGTVVGGWRATALESCATRSCQLGRHGLPNCLEDASISPHAVAALGCMQAFFLRVPIDIPWPPGQQRTFFFRSWWAATAPASAFASVPFRAPNPGLVVTAFTNIHQSERWCCVWVCVGGWGGGTRWHMPAPPWAWSSPVPPSPTSTRMSVGWRRPRPQQLRRRRQSQPAASMLCWLRWHRLL